MPVPQHLQGLLDDYLKKVTGSKSEKEEKRKKLHALNATTRKELAKQASQFVLDSEGNCPKDWVTCMAGICAPTIADCESANRNQ